MKSKLNLKWLKSYNLLTFETIDSTNSEAFRLVSAGSVGNFVIMSRIQTGGKGTKGRQWISINGNLHTSILLEMHNIQPDRYPQLPFVIANAIYDVIAKLAARQKISLDIKVKWPNDILISEKKIAGILLESITVNGKNYVVIGLGVNIMEAPTILNRKVTCLLDEGIELQNPEEFLTILMNRFEKLYASWSLDHNFIKTRQKWMRHAYNLNKLVTINDGVSSVAGIFKEIDLTGAMRLQLKNGEFKSFHSGEII